MSYSTITRTLAICLTAALACTGAQATEISFLNTAATTSGPPYPSTPVSWELSHIADPAETLSITLVPPSPIYPPDPIIPLTVRATVDATRTDITALAQIFWAAPPDDNYPPARFDLLVELGPLGGSTPVLGIDPTPFIPSPTSFDVTFDTAVNGGTVSHTMHFEIGSNIAYQPLTFSNVVVGPPQSPAFQIQFDLDNTAPVDGNVPLFIVETTAEFTPDVGEEALIDINPDTLNRNGKGNWITAYITLPVGLDVAEIDPTTIMITSLTGSSCDPAYTQGADLSFTPQIGDRDEDGVPDLTVKFDRQQLLANICLDDVSITVEGDLTGGEHFVGADQIRVIERGKP